MGGEIPQPRQRSTRKRGFATQRDAKAFAATSKPQNSKASLFGLGRPDHDRRVRSGVAGPQRGHMKPVDASPYEPAWRVHVEPAGREGGSPRRASEVAAWVAELSASAPGHGCERRTRCLRAILEDAMRDRMLVSNPARGLSCPRAPRRNVYLTAEQLQMLADECGQYRSLVLLLGIGGLRWGRRSRCDRATRLPAPRGRAAPQRRGVGADVPRRHAQDAVRSARSRSRRLVIDALARDRRGQGRDELLWPATRTPGYLRRRRGRVVAVPSAVRALPDDRSDVPPDDSARTAAHRCLAGDQARGQSEGGATDARARLRGR